MKTLISCFLLFCIPLLKLQSQDLSQGQIQEDYNYLINALEEGHPGLYWFNSKEEFNKTSNKVKTSLSDVTNVMELQSLFTDINNVISCGHTAIILPESYKKKVDSINLFLPFNIALIEGKVLVAESFTADLSRGDQLLSINNEPIDKIIAQIQRFIPVDKDIMTKRARSIEIIFSYYYALYIGNPENFKIDFIAQSGGKRTRKKIVAIGLDENMYKSLRDFAPAQTPIEFSVDDSMQAAIFKLATFSRAVFKANEIIFQDTIKAIFEHLEANGINNLVLDLRWNNGGTMPLAEYLFSFFIDSIHQFYDDAEIKQAVVEGQTKYVRSRNMLPMLQKQFGILEPIDGVYSLPGEKILVNPSLPPFRGNLYLLTNGFSFSATSAFISLIQENNLGLVVGETPGGAFDGLNAGPPIIVALPNSKIRLFYRPIGTRFNVEIDKSRANVDVEVENTLAGFMNGRDEQLEYVLKELVMDQ